MPGKKRVVPRDQHSISRQQFSRGALDVLYGLHRAGYEAFLVGGCLRDLLVGKPPKDFDVATDASPEQVHALFRRSRLIGRRFRIVHVMVGREVIEVSTFRALTNADSPHSRQHQRTDSGMVLRDNVFGTMEEDAMRRDFTTNALYYNIADFSLHDLVGSLADIKARRLRLIGDPAKRYREDPVRMLRAARFVAKLDFQLDASSETPIRELGYLLEQIPPARLFDEQLKLFLNGYAKAAFHELERLGLFAILFPDSAASLQQSGPEWYQMVIAAMQNTDKRIKAGKPVTPAFLLAVLLWPVIKQEKGNLHQIMSKAITRQVRIVAIPKRFSHVMRDIWTLQSRLESRKKPDDLMQHRRFRAAYDFLLLREVAGLLPDKTLGNWWTAYQEATPEARQQLLDERPSRRRSRGHHSRGSTE